MQVDRIEKGFRNQCPGSRQNRAGAGQIPPMQPRLELTRRGSAKQLGMPTRREQYSNPLLHHFSVDSLSSKKNSVNIFQNVSVSHNGRLP